MIGDIHNHLEVTPFVPFRVRTADGREYPVPTPDHLYLPPGAKRVVITDDEGSVVILSASLISGLMHEDPSHKRTAT